MIFKGRKKESTSWVNVFSTFRKKNLPIYSDQKLSEKATLKQLVVTVFVSIFLCAFFAAYMINKNPQFFLKIANPGTAKKVFKAITLGPFRWLDSHVRGADLPEVYVDIKFKHFRKLQEKRKESLQRGVLITTEGDYVPAKIRHEGRTIKVKIRLKGDWARNPSDKKMSFRVQVKDGDHLLGMRRFSLQNPKARIYDGDRLFFEAIKRENILAPRHSFVDLTVNGTKMGIMALEEHFSKELLESQGRRAGVILKFDESMVWLAESEVSKGRGFEGVYDNYKNATIKPFRINRIKSSKKLTVELENATRLLRAFVDGTLEPSKVFDPILMGRFIAVGDFWGAWHGLRWHNLRFYYNAITGYLEPIGFDAGIAYNQKPAHDPTSEPIVTKILDDSIRKIYMETLQRLVREAKDGTTAHWVEDLRNNNLRALHKEYFWLEGVDLSLLTQWAEQKLNSTKRKDLLYPKILHVYLVKGETGFYLELQNPLPYEVIVSNIQWVGTSEKEPVKLNHEEGSLVPFSLASSEKGGLPTEKKIRFKSKGIEAGSQFMVTANIKGDRENHTIKSIFYFSNATKPIVPKPNLAKTLFQHPYLELDEKRNILRVKSGQWEVNSWMVVPEGFELILSEGTTLYFKPSAGLLARGPVTIKGTKDRPVILQGTKSPTKANYWQGIVVMKSEVPSHWSHVKIKNTQGIKNNDWVITAGVTFYESDVYLKNVTFSENRCEDALNIIRSTFDLVDVDIKNAISDGLDADFSNGAVTGGVFENLGYAGGGDGIDLSGARVTVTGTQFRNIADKAISVGEESRLISDKLSIQNVGVGIVSKDGSRATIQSSKIMKTKLAGLMVYTKKPVYPAATLHAKDIIFKQSTPNALVQNGNELMLSGALIEPSEFDVRELYENSMKSGLK